MTAPARTAVYAQERARSSAHRAGLLHKTPTACPDKYRAMLALREYSNWLPLTGRTWRFRLAKLIWRQSVFHRIVSTGPKSRPLAKMGMTAKDLARLIASL